MCSEDRGCKSLRPAVQGEGGRSAKSVSAEGLQALSHGVSSLRVFPPMMDVLSRRVFTAALFRNKWDAPGPSVGVLRLVSVTTGPWRLAATTDGDTETLV